MINSDISALPALAGVSLLHKLSQAVRWAFSQFMSAPLQNVAIALLGIAIVVAANNALFLQTAAHPAPLFFSASNQVEAVHLKTPQSAPTPMPAPAQRTLAPSISSVVEPVALETAPVASDTPHDDGKVSNEQLANAQRVLTSMGLFSGKIDGFYGPQTAQALRAFEARNGMAPKGALTANLITLILQAPVIQQPSAPPVAIVQSAVPVNDVVSQPEANLIIDSAPELPPALDPLVSLAQSASQQVAAVSTPPAPTEPAVTSQGSAVVRDIQRALASLGFLNGAINGIVGESTARAIRNFEVFNNFEVSGEISPELLDLLKQAGATI